MDEDYNEEVIQYPERAPQAGINRYDVIRILMMPLVGFAQGTAEMYEHLTLLFMHQSEIHDKKKAAKEMEKALK